MNEIDQKLADQKVLDIFGDIDFEKALDIREKLKYLFSSGSPDITITISSSGGLLAYGLDIYDMIRIYPGKVKGLVIGTAKSAAALILQACDTRQCATHSEILIHSISSRINLDILESKSRFKKKILEVKSQNNAQIDILCKRTGKSKKVIKKIMREDRILSAKEALEFGLIDEII